MTRKTLILAGNASQAAQYVRDRNLSTLDVIYVSGEHHVRGLSEPPYVICGTFWERPDAIRIWQNLKLCYPPEKRKLMKAPPEIEVFLQPPAVWPATPPAPVVKEVTIGPVVKDFKHIKETKPENNGFKRIRK